MTPEQAKKLRLLGPCGSFTPACSVCMGRAITDLATLLFGWMGATS